MYRKWTAAAMAFSVALLLAIPASAAPFSLTGTVGAITDTDASSGGYYLRWVGDPAPVGYGHQYQWGSPAIDCTPRISPVEFAGTFDVSGLAVGDVAFVGLLDKSLLATGVSGFMSGAYAYIFRNTATTVRVGPSDGNMGGEIVQVFGDYAIDADPIIDLVITVGDGTISVAVNGGDPKTDTYGDVEALNTADAYPGAEFATGAVPGWTLYPIGSTAPYDMTLSGCEVVDTSGPDIAITAPIDGGSYERGTPVEADYECSDASGVASCDGDVPDGSPVDTSEAGHFSFTVGAADTLGNESSLTVEYNVLYGGCLIDEDLASKTMTLLADCTVDETFLVPNGYTFDGNGFTLFAVDPAGGHFLGAVVTNKGALAHVTKLTVQTVNLADVCDPSSPDDTRLRGILFEGAGGSITDNVISVGQGLDGLTGCQEGNGIEVRHEPFDATGSDNMEVTITGNTITDYVKGGIVANGSVAVLVTGNVITGWGPVGVPYAAQNGIQVGFGGTATIRGNTVSGNSYTPKDWVACGLLYFQADGVRASANTLFDNERDVCNFGRGGGQYNPTIP